LTDILYQRELVDIQDGEWPYDLIQNLSKSSIKSALKYRYGEVAVGVSDSFDFYSSSGRGFINQPP